MIVVACDSEIDTVSLEFGPRRRRAVKLARGCARFTRLTPGYSPFTPSGVNTSRPIPGLTLGNRQPNLTFAVHKDAQRAYRYRAKRIRLGFDNVALGLSSLRNYYNHPVFTCGA